MLSDVKRFIVLLIDGMDNIAEEGKKLVWIGAYVALAGLFLVLFGVHYGGGDVLLLGLIFAGFSAFFFRNPKRERPYREDEIVSPADGHVLSVRTEGNPDVVVIRIFLSIFDVHVQRATISGTIGQTQYTKGSFLCANNKDADKNERNMIPITSGQRFAHVEQITGAIARRIACWVKPGDEVKSGQLIGLIYFGSQVAVYLPAKTRVLATVGQKVEGGLTVLALWDK